jgi:GntR family transcriptional regulator of arabinose operon
VAQDIVAKIASGAWKPGDRLPSERALCELYEVSQITVRRALRELSHSGRVYSRHGLGWFVDDEPRPQPIGRRVAIVLAEIDSLMSPVMRALSERLGAQSVSIELVFAPDEPGLRPQAVERALSNGAEAVLIVVEGAEQGAQARYRPLAERQAPLLLLLRDIADVHLPAVVLDEQLCMEILTRHVLGLGHTQVAYVGSDPATSEGWRRYRGFAAALWNEGLELPLDWVFAAPLTEEREASRFREAVQGRDHPSAVVCASVGRAGEVMALLRQTDRRCPGDIAVVGLGDSPFAQWLPSPLTAFRFDLDGLARQTVRLAQELLAGQAVESAHFAGQLVVRESCGPAIRRGGR